MERKVRFFWWQNSKVWSVTGRDLDEITLKAKALQKKLKAQNFKIQGEKTNAKTL